MSGTSDAWDDAAQQESHRLSLARRAALVLGGLSQPSRIPFMGFALGAACADSWTWGFFGMASLLAAGITPVIGVLLSVYALAVMGFSHDFSWGQVFFLGFALWRVMEARAHQLFAIDQTELLLKDMLAPSSPIRFSEIVPPPSLLAAFPNYASKNNGVSLIDRFARGEPTDTNGVKDIATFRRRPLRLFQIHQSAERWIAASVAFPFAYISSLVFLRQGMESMNAAQRFHLYHELGHGTPEGADILLRTYRWKVSAGIAYASLGALTLMIGMQFLENSNRTVMYLAIAALVVASILRLRASAFAEKMSAASAEVLADSIALSHPEFLHNETWKIRATRLASRLRDEIRDLPENDPRMTPANSRVRWLEVHLGRGKLLPYFSCDVDHKIWWSGVAYVACGYFAHPSGPALIVFSVATAVAVVIMLCWLPFIGMKAEKCLRDVQAAINRLTVKTESDSRAS